MQRPTVSVRRRLAALALAVLVPLLLFAVLVSPWLDSYRDGEDAIAALQARWQRLVVNSAGAAELDARIAALRDDPRLEGLLLQGDTAALAAAALQGRIKALVSEHGASLLSTNMLAAGSEGQLGRVAVSLSLRADHPALMALLEAIENDRPWLFVDLLQVTRYAAAVSNRQGRRQPLDVRLQVYGYRQGGPA